jgi:hypothetical protein
MDKLADGSFLVLLISPKVISCNLRVTRSSTQRGRRVGGGGGGGVIV